MSDTTPTDIDWAKVYNHPTSRALDEEIQRTAEAGATPAATPAAAPLHREPAPPSPTLYRNFLAGEIERRAPTLYDTIGWTKAEVDDFRTDMQALQTQTGLDDGAMTRIAHAFLDGKTAATRATDRAAFTAERERQAQEQAQALRAELRLRHGQAGAEALLARTEGFVKQHAALRETLASFGLWGDPEIAEAILHHVHTQGIR